MGKEKKEIIRVNESLMDYFADVMDFDNESEEYIKTATLEFKAEIRKALNNTATKKDIRWVRTTLF